MNLILAHQRRKVELDQVWPKPVDVKAIRKRVKMSQAEFSRVYGINKRALQEWEQGGRQPDSAARAYLTVIAKEPAVVYAFGQSSHSGGSPSAALPRPAWSAVWARLRLPATRRRQCAVSARRNIGRRSPTFSDRR